MILQLISSQPMGTALVTGLASTGTLSTVVVKAAYTLTDDGSGNRSMTPASDPLLHQIVYTDTGDFLFEDGGNLHVIPASALRTLPDGSKEFDFGGVAHPASALDGFVTDYEADIGIEKSRVDIVVEGHVPNPASGGSITINGILWTSRTTTATATGDSAIHLFGRHAKGVSGRTVSTIIAPVGSLPGGYTPLFNNYYRRSSGFTVHGSAATNLPSGGTVRVFQTADQSDAPYTFALPNPFIMSARYRTYCGHGPDKAPRWNTGPVITLRADTLIIRPASHSAIILWRGSWPYADEPADTYRKVQIIEGAF